MTIRDNRDYIKVKRGNRDYIRVIRDNRDYIRVLLYSYYTTITGWGVFLTYTLVEVRGHGSVSPEQEQEQALCGLRTGGIWGARIKDQGWGFTILIGSMVGNLKRSVLIRPSTTCHRLTGQNCFKQRCAVRDIQSLSLLWYPHETPVSYQMLLLLLLLLIVGTQLRHPQVSVM